MSRSQGLEALTHRNEVINKGDTTMTSKQAGKILKKLEKAGQLQERYQELIVEVSNEIEAVASGIQPEQ